MPAEFRAETFQNEFLPSGTGEVHAIMTVTAGDGTTASTASQTPRLFGILCDVSGSMEGGKIHAAKAALTRLIDLLPDSASFFVVAGADAGTLLCPVTRADAAGKRRAHDAILHMRAFGGTMISRWLRTALDQFNSQPNTIRQAILLTDGQNDPNDQKTLTEALDLCEGIFQCDCRGVGTDWNVDQLRAIAGRLLGTTDIIPTPAQMEDDFRHILAQALTKTVSDVFLRLWTPQGAQVRFCKEVSPAIVDLTTRARVVDPARPQLREYPTGAWGRGEQRDFHFCIQVAPGRVGEEVLAGRASLVVTTAGVENKVAESRILAIWTDDTDKSTRIDRVVAHYTGQAELATSIQQGLEARAHGDTERATRLLGKAVQIAEQSGNEATQKLLRKVVDVEDAERGTVRLKSTVALEDSMALDTRSTKTARIPKP